MKEITNNNKISVYDKLAVDYKYSNKYFNDEQRSKPF